MNKCNQCPYCGGTAKINKTSVDFANSTIHRYYVECTKCGVSTSQYNTKFAYYLDGKRFSPMTEREAISKAVCDWNNEIFDIQTRLAHMSDAEKMLWYTENLLSIAWYGAMVPLESLRWETAWKIRKMAEGKGLLVLHSDTEYDLREVAKVLLDNDKVKSIVYKYLKEIGELNYNS